MNKHTPELTQPQLSFDEIEYGYCHCGCGGKTKIAKNDRAGRGWIKGQPIRFIAGHYKTPPVYATLADYFWTYCTPNNKDKCWEWQGATTPAGYGLMNYRGQMYYAHRTSWELHNESIPDDLHCLHHCDNPPCCNPAHLFLGTQQDNIQDKVSKKRHAFGERSSSAKLSKEDVLQIRRLGKQGWRNCDIGRKFNIGGSYVGEILRGEKRSHD